MARAGRAKPYTSLALVIVGFLSLSIGLRQIDGVERSELFRHAVERATEWIYPALREAAANTSDTSHADLHFRKAYDLQEREKWKLAQRQFEIGLGLEPDHEWALAFHGWGLLKSKKWTEAERTLGRLYELDPLNDYAPFGVIAALRGNHRRADLEQFYDDYARVVAEHPEVLEETLRRVYDEGYDDSAEALLARVTAARPDDDTLQAQLASRLFHAEHFDEAAAHARRAIEINPENGRAHSLLGILLGRAEDHAAATEHLRRARELLGEEFEHDDILEHVESKVVSKVTS